MAQKRMFDKAIIDTDRFMDLSMSAKALYFLLGMEADDEGFVSYRKVMRIHGGNEDDIKILGAKSFIISFQNGVVVITDWNKNNYLDKNRLKVTEYQKERKSLTLTEFGEYVLNTGSTSIEEYRGEERRIEYISSDKNQYTPEFEKFWIIYPKKVGKLKTFSLWKKLNQSEIIKIMLDVPLRVEDDKWKGGFIRDPERYVKYRQWEDEIISSKPKNSIIDLNNMKF